MVCFGAARGNDENDDSAGCLHFFGAARGNDAHDASDCLRFGAARDNDSYDTLLWRRPAMMLMMLPIACVLWCHLLPIVCFDLLLCRPRH